MSCSAFRRVGARAVASAALINERLMGKPATPLSQHWQAQVLPPISVAR